jgi:ribosome recycling factor
MDLDEIQLNCEEAMEKALEYFKNETRGLRTGRASTGLVEFIKVDYYGSMTDLRSMALITTPEATQILIRPFDATSVQAIAKAIQSAGLGLNPMSEGKQIRVNIPSLSGERRNQLVATLKQMAEATRVSIRNARRDANKLLDAAEKDKSLHISEDAAEKAKEAIQDLVKKYEGTVDTMVENKTKEILTV